MEVFMEALPFAFVAVSFLIAGAVFGYAKGVEDGRAFPRVAFQPETRHR